MPFKSDLFKNQTDILRWLHSRGNSVDYGTGTRTAAEHFRVRSCESKKRFELEPHPGKGMKAYKCRFCDGWHLATDHAS